MPSLKDPTDAIRRRALSFPDVAKGTACTQSAFKVGTRTFLFIGPGAKGQGFKAMFKLEASLPRARELAAKDLTRIGAEATGWVTARFTAEKPLPEHLWSV